MKLIFVLAIVALTAAPVVIGGLKRQESGETENLRFAYDSRTHMLMLLRQATCYIFVLTEDERTAVHTDSGLRTLEVTEAIISRRRRMRTCLRAIQYARLNPDCVAKCTAIDHELLTNPLPQGGIL